MTYYLPRDLASAAEFLSYFWVLVKFWFPLRTYIFIFQTFYNKFLALKRNNMKITL